MTTGTELVRGDQSQREQALDISKSCCVQAPAGSGKTELLTQRVLKLLANCQKPEEILAITFTRKAAAEMRNRLLANLAEASEMNARDKAKLEPHKAYTIELAEKVLARDEELGWSLQINTNRLRINTIDSFNQFLVAQLPVTSALGMLPNVTEKPREVFREAVRETLKELDSNSLLSSELTVLLGHLNNQWLTLENLFCNLLHNRDQWLGYILAIQKDTAQTRNLMEQTLQGIVDTTLQDLDTALSPYLVDLLPVLNFAAKNLADEGNTILSSCDLEDSLPENTYQTLDQWRAIVSLLITDKAILRKTVVAAQGFPAQSKEGTKEEKAYRKLHKDLMLTLLKNMAEDDDLKEKLEEFYYLPTIHFDDSQWRVLESLTTILPQVAIRLNMIFAKHQLTDYPHISAAALEALGDEESPTDLALRLDYHLKHILVDEFQDTSTMQIELLEKLTRGWEDNDGRTLFIVGDGMQSCYGFRNARVGLFLAAREHGIGNIRFADLRLTRNFRSDIAVVEWVNNVFKHAFPEKDDISRGGVSFNEAQAVHENSGLSGVKTNLIVADKELEFAKERQRFQEAHQIARQVKYIQSNNPDDTIAILVRSRNHLIEIIPALREHELQWNATDIDPLLSYPVIRDLLSLVRAMLNPGDIIAWLALLRSPMIGLQLADIHCISHLSQENRNFLWHAILSYKDNPVLSKEAKNILHRVVPVLKLARNERQRLPLRDQIENLWVLLGGHHCLENPSLAKSVEQFFTLLEEHDSGSDITDIHLFESEVNALYGSGQHPEARLHIMTIHKAKGLEFHHVIIPGLERLTGRNENPLLHWKEHITGSGQKQLLMSLPAQKGRDRENDPIYRYLKYETELEQGLESTRLLYIAVTRAIRQCILYCSVLAEKGELKAPAAKSLLARIWPQLLERMPEDDIVQIPVDESSPLPKEFEIKEAGKSIITRRLKPEWRNPVDISSAKIKSANEQGEIQDLAHEHMLEKQIGNILHYCLMLISRGKLETDSEAKIKHQEQNWRRQLAPLTDNVDDAIATIYQQLDGCKGHEKFHWLVTENHDESNSELSLSDYSSYGRREYIVDRTFIDDKGTRWIIDYKSSCPAANETLETFFSRQEEHYRVQLEKYAQLFKSMETQPVRAALFFTAIPHFHELKLNSAQQVSQESLF